MIADESSETELKILIDFFGLDSSVMKWRYHPEKNFLCLYKPVKFCLSKNNLLERANVNKHEQMFFGSSKNILLERAKVSKREQI